MSEEITIPHVSPFRYLIYKEDEGSLVALLADSPDTAGTNANRQYVSLLTIDGVECDDIIAYASEHNKNVEAGVDTSRIRALEGAQLGWEVNLCLYFPDYFYGTCLESGKNPEETFLLNANHAAFVEYVDMSTSEVLEATVAATSGAYNEMVQGEAARQTHQGSTGAGGHASKGKKHHKESNSDDEYEDVEDEEEEEGTGNEPATRAESRKMHFLEMFTTQLETLMSIGHDLGLTPADMAEVYERAILKGAHSVPTSVEECVAEAQKHCDAANASAAAGAGDAADSEETKDESMLKYLRAVQARTVPGQDASPQCQQQ